MSFETKFIKDDDKDTIKYILSILDHSFKYIVKNINDKIVLFKNRPSYSLITIDIDKTNNNVSIDKNLWYSIDEINYNSPILCLGENNLSYGFPLPVNDKIQELFSKYITNQEVTEVNKLKNLI